MLLFKWIVPIKVPKNQTFEQSNNRSDRVSAEKLSSMLTAEKLLMRLQVKPTMKRLSGIADDKSRLKYTTIMVFSGFSI